MTIRAVVASMVAFGLAAALLALAYAPMADLRSLVAYLVTLQAVGVGIVVANVWMARG